MATKASPFGRVERTLAWRYLRAKREHGGASLTAIISFIGIALAVWALIAIMSIMAGFRATLLDALLGGQPHVYGVVSEIPASEIDPMIDMIRQVPGVASAHPYLEEQVLAIHEGVASGGALVKAISTAELQTLPFLEDGGASAIEAGFGEGRFGGDVILMGAFLASDLRVGQGDKVRLISQETNASPFGTAPRSKTYTVGGLFKTGSVELDKAYVFMPLEQGQVFFKKRDEYELIDIRLDNPEETGPAITRIQAALDRYLYMFSWQTQRGAYLGALNLERSMMRLVMLVLITITALNIITGVVMLVKNKTRDIAILRTIGASRSSMMRVFVMIGAFLGLAGALTGTVLGILTVTYISEIEDFLGWVRGQPLFPPDVYGLEGLPARLDWGEVIFTFLWATSMSIFVTLWPAWRAAQLDPVEALRFE